MSKKIALSCLITSAILASSLAMVLSSSYKIISSHTKAANEVKTVTNVTSSSLTMSNNYSVEIESSGYASGGLFSLSSLGYIRNSEPIRGITEITLTYGTGSGWAKIVPCYYDYENDQVSPSDSWPDPSESADFSSAPIDYFEIYNPSENDSITITGMTIAYGCSTETYTFSVSFTPDWNDKTAPEHADIYIAGTPELISDGTATEGWSYKKLTYNNGTYSYNSLNYVPQGKYSYTFYAYKNGAAFNWGNQTTNGTQNITLTSNYLDTTSYSWEREPGSATAYTLNVVFAVTHSSAQWVTWAGFNYSKTTSNISNGDWGALANWTSQTDNTDYYYSNPFEFESTSTTVYVAMKIGVSDGPTTINPAYVGETSSKAFEINYKGGATTATLTVNLTLNGVTSTYAATSYNIETSGGIDISGISHPNVTLDIYDNDYAASTIFYGRRQIVPSFESGSDTFKATYSGNNIRIDTIDGNQYITALKAGTSTVVTLTCDSDSSVTCNFTVTVPSSTYTATAARDNSYNNRAQITSTEEGWFNSTSVDQIDNMGEDFFHGMDISSCKALYENGSKFYNTSGVEQSLFYILKDAGVNWIRLKLWVDPYTEGGKSYGGGESDINNTLWMAYEAKAAGMKVLLDLHYSDYWTHPGQQILPKAWANASSVSELAAYIKNYTKNTLNTFNSNGCLPDMVQLGNEISSGSFLSLPGTNSETMHSTTFVPGYLYNISGYKSEGNYSLSRNFTYNGYGTSNMNAYLNVGVEAVNEINASLSSSIKTVVHWAKGSTISASKINDFFNAITADYDYAAISFYPYYCFDNISGAQTILNGLNITTANEGWFIAEISYPFSGYSWVYENNKNVTGFVINNWNTGDTNIKSSYAFNAAGQANLIHDVTAAVVNAGGKGMFYWEPAWVPNINVGWSGEGSSCSWSNQGFFSYDGKAIANINLFAQMSPYINL